MQEGIFRLPDYNDPKHGESILEGKLILGDEDFHSMRLDDLARKVDSPRNSILLDARPPEAINRPHTISAYLGNEKLIANPNTAIQDQID